METLDEVIKLSICIGPAKNGPACIASEIRQFIKNKFKVAFIQIKTDRELLRLKKLLSSIVKEDK